MSCWSPCTRRRRVRRGSDVAAVPVPAGETCEGEADRPALGRLDEPVERVLVDGAAKRLQERAGLRSVHAQVLDAQDGQTAGGAQAGERQGRLVPRADRHVRALRQLVEQHARGTASTSALCSRCPSSRTSRNGLAAATAAASPGRMRSSTGGARMSRSSDQSGVDGGDAVEGGGEVPQEHERVVLARVELQPGRRLLDGRRPLRQQGALAVPGRRLDEDERLCGVKEPVDERLTHDQPPAARAPVATSIAGARSLVGGRPQIAGPATVARRPP